MADTQPYRPKKRGFETAKDMAWSLGPILVLVVVFAYFIFPSGGDAVRVVDASSDISNMAEYADFPIIAPSGLSKQWRPTSSNLLRDDASSDSPPTGLTIGYVTPEDKFARFTIQKGARSKIVQSAVNGADVTKDPDGEAITVNGRQWTPITTSKGGGFVNVQGSGATAIVTVVAGGASTAELSALVTSLRTVA